MKLTAASLRPSQQRAESRRVERRQAALSKMNPAQRVQALKRESAVKAGQERKADDKTLRTKAVVGTKQEREAFRDEKKALQRERALEAMTPEQREKTLKQEAAFKASEAAKQKQEQQDKALRTVGKVGNKEEHQKSRAEKDAAQRDRALAAMTPEQREQALKQEAAAQAAEAAAQEQQRQAKLRRTVGIVGDKAEREKFAADKQALRRSDMLAAASPDQRESLLQQEAAFKAAQAAQEARAAAEKAAKTVAIVGDKSARDAFGKSAARPRGTPTTFVPPGLALSQSALAAELALLTADIALLS